MDGDQAEPMLLWARTTPPKVTEDHQELLGNVLPYRGSAIGMWARPTLTHA
jgi:hypothetical protein